MFPREPATAPDCDANHLTGPSVGLDSAPMKPFAYFLIRKRGLWYACTFRHVNGDPTEVAFIWTKQLKDATDFLSDHME